MAYALKQKLISCTPFIATDSFAWAAGAAMMANGSALARRKKITWPFAA